ncbi:L-threonylcarbamoyladenylate synthase [Shimia thalassica]|uniref:L-threonylcarbamoyladenylate synthase n=1 Tax=Shimia thalassica TaxID=1715693 RepID=UPI0027377374|nr:L-threonylcarbamoyladenylate synthase [Shimia thalassica]MDP2579216.1 L-threonylcarbamoyladenylate synthase [Shimia thalassica]
METENLLADQAGYARASTILHDGGLVAFPTETVYGLGGDARNDMSVARIFEAKGRPRFNPLIVHVDSVETAQLYVEWSDTADRLASIFWPGPLTLVLPLKPNTGLSALVTADLPTLAVRVPEHPVANALLAEFGGPVAAPSANPSGKISPTKASHVARGLSGRIDAILDGGDCGVGLESTIVGLAGQPTLLRPGGLPTEAIEAALGTTLDVFKSGDPLTAPGQMTSHYAPGAPVRLNATDLRDNEMLLGFGPVEATVNLSPSGDLVEAASNLFHHLHMMDSLGAEVIAISPIPDHGLGRAINDRLLRAAAPRP